MRYEINGIEYPSCTEILGLLDKSAALMTWAAGLSAQYVIDNINKPEYSNNKFQLQKDAKLNYRDISSDSMDIGSEVHSSIEAYIKFGKDKIGQVRDQVANALLAFFEWEKTNNVKWIESEMPVVNEKIGYAGTLDAIAEVNGVMTCIDFKSSKDIYDEYITQVVAYKYARESMQGNYDIKGPTGNWTKIYSASEIKECAILRLDKESGMPEYYPIDSQDKIQKEYRAFCALIDYYYVAKKRRLKNNPRVK